MNGYESVRKKYYEEKFFRYSVKYFYVENIKMDQNPGVEFWFIIHLESCTLRASIPLSTINGFIGCYEGQMKIYV